MRRLLFAVLALASFAACGAAKFPVVINSQPDPDDFIGAQFAVALREAIRANSTLEATRSVAPGSLVVDIKSFNPDPAGTNNRTSYAIVWILLSDHSPPAQIFLRSMAGSCGGGKLAVCAGAVSGVTDSLAESITKARKNLAPAPAGGRF